MLGDSEDPLRYALASLQESLAKIDAVGGGLGRGDLVEDVIYRFEHVSLHIYPSEIHKRPHFHIRFKNQHHATYDLETGKRLAGKMPVKYERAIIQWAKANVSLLREEWARLRPGNQTDVVCQEKYAS